MIVFTGYSGHAVACWCSFVRYHITANCSNQALQTPRQSQWIWHLQLICRSARMWKYDDLHELLTCWLDDSELSNVTPRLLTDWLTDIITSCVLKVSMLSRCLSMAPVPKMIVQCNLATKVYKCCITDKRLCYCRGTARRATSVEILWPFFDWAINKKLC